MKSEPGSLSALLRWFRHEWTAEMGAGRIHVRDTDEGGDPDWHGLFARIVERTAEERTGSSSPGLPIRFHLRGMARGSHRGRARAEFLFRLACHDFDVMATARETSPAAYDCHGEQWALDFAEASLRRLHRRCFDVRWNDQDNKPRRYLPRKSEAQSIAEAAAA